MTDVEALRDFVTTNLTLLTAKDYDAREYKKSHRRFFVDAHSKRFGLPANSEVARALISLLKQRGVQAANILSILDEARFFLQLAEGTRTALRDLVLGKSISPLLGDTDIDLVRTLGAYEAARKIKAREIEDSAQERLAELDKKIDEKRTAYEALPSLLDSSEIPEPDFVPDIEDNKSWWERFYLRADPFARKDGLSAIPADLYDQVIIRTRPFQDTLAALHKTPDYLFNTGFLLSGGFGCGKTTFIDYLSYALVGKDILPIRIACGRAMADSAAFADSLYQRLQKEFRAEAIKIALMSATEVLDLEPEDYLIELAKRINSRRNGIVVFLDDYHKHRSHFPQIFDFLGTLQVLKDSLTRASTNVGFIVSGLPEWKDELLRNGQLSGFLDKPPIEMPDVTAKLVCDVFNRRIKAFCYEKTPRLIKETFVERLVQESQGHAGLRDYLTKIVSELSSNNQAIVDTPVEIPAAHLAEVRSRFESDPSVKLGFNKLLYETKFKQLGQRQIEKCLELLVSVALQNGVAEDAPQFRDNRFYFMTLRDCGLIHKQNSRRNICEWNLNPRIKRLVTAIESDLGYGIADYLLKLFAYKGYDSRRNAEQPAELREVLDLKRLLGLKGVVLERSVEEHLRKGLRAAEAFLSEPDVDKAGVSPIDVGQRAVDSLSSALFELDGSLVYFVRNELRELRSNWPMHPFYEEAIEEMFARVDDWRQEGTRQRRAEVRKRTTNVLELVLGWIIALLEDKCLRQECGLLHRPIAHGEDEIDILRAARTLAFSSRATDHYAYLKRITDHLEDQIRRFLFVTGSLVFGDKYFDHGPSAVKSYAYKNLGDRPSYAVEINLFDGLTRSQLRSIFIDGNDIKEQIVKPLQLTWKREDWETFVDIFSRTNLLVAHQQVHAFSSEERQRYLRYCVLAEELMAEMNRAVSRLIETSLYVKPEERAPEDLRYLFRCALRRPEGLQVASVRWNVLAEWPKGLLRSEEHGLSNKAYETVRNTLVGSMERAPDGIVVQDLLDVEYIASHYRATVREVILSLAYGRYCTGEFEVAPWFGSCVMIRKARGTRLGA